MIGSAGFQTPPLVHVADVCLVLTPEAYSQTGGFQPLPLVQEIDVRPVLTPEAYSQTSAAGAADAC